MLNMCSFVSCCFILWEKTFVGSTYGYNKINKTNYF